MSGLKSGIVKLTPYSALWARRFHREALRLRRHMGRARYTLEHIGSTAVPGLEAKPILDLALMIPSFSTLPRWIRRLQTAGYVYQGEYGLPGRHFFTGGNPVTRHLHLVRAGSEHWERWLRFRDYLRATPAAARRYARLKRSLARRYATNRTAYTQAKSPLVNQLLNQAEAWQKRVYAAPPS